MATASANVRARRGDMNSSRRHEEEEADVQQSRAIYLGVTPICNRDHMTEYGFCDVPPWGSSVQRQAATDISA